ncbi:MAG: SIR2 family protein [Alloprevotella tannerae]|nr:SIR2 family protein [Alloprevotella tannerae]
MENIPQRLKEAIKNDELVLFVGSGLSWKLKNTAGNTLGGWKEMVSSMLSYLKDKEYITAKEQRFCLKLEPIKALQRLENKGIDREKVRDFLQGYFTLGKKNKFPLQEKLYSLSTKIITTNYDLAFEEAIEKLDKEKAYKGQNKKLSKLLADPVFLFKLHGCIEDINSLVLFPSDYRKLYNNYDRDAALALLVFKFLIFSKTFLFIGTGMDEHQIINFFEEIKEVRDSFSQKHYIITTDPLSIPTNFLTSIKINDYAEIPSYIDQLLDIKEKTEEEKNPEKKLLLKQLKASKKEKEALEKELDKEKDKNKRQALLLKREANNHFRLGLKHHQAEEYLEAAEEYKTASELKPEYSEAYNNWGVALMELAEIKSGNEAEELYKEACKKYDKAITYKQDYHEAYNNWANSLSELAKTKSGSEAKELLNEAIKKFQQAVEHGGKSYNLACLYAIRNQKAEALKYLNFALARNEITVEFVEQDEDWKELRNDPDFQDLLSRYKK